MVAVLCAVPSQWLDAMVHRHSALPMYADVRNPMTSFIKRPQIKALKGYKSIQRIICGGCHDFKVRLYCLYEALLE